MQAKLGFELEVPVTLMTPERGNVPRQTTILRGDGFEIVGDSSLAAGTVPSLPESPTIIEVISEPVDEHTPEGIERLRHCLADIERIRDKLKALTKGFSQETTVGSLASAADLTLGHRKYAKYLLNVRTDNRKLAPETASVHYTVGVALHNVERAAAWAVEGSPDTAQSALMKEGHEFAKQKLQQVAQKLRRKVNLSDPAIRGFLYLAFSQVAALELHERKKRSIPKNRISLLSRASLASLRENPAVADFVADHGEEVEEAFLEVEPLRSDDAAALLAYALNTAPINLESSPFGSQELPLEPIGATGMVGPPLEMRTLGQDLTSKQIRKTTESVWKASRSGFKP